MLRKLILFNFVLGAISLVLILYIVREVTWTPALPYLRLATPQSTNVGDAAYVASNTRPSPAVIVARNLFDPARREPAAALPEPAPVIGAPPILHGVFISDATAIAYLEDASTKRTTPHRIGEVIGNLKLITIAPDHVVLVLGHQMVRVVLRDERKIHTARLEEMAPNLMPPAAPSHFRGAIPPGAAAELQPRPPRGM